MKTSVSYGAICFAIFTTLSLAPLCVDAFTQKTIASCVIDFDLATRKCTGKGVSVIEYSKTDKQALVRATVDVKSSDVLTRATYGDKVSGWTLNIGDSATNDGWGGDRGTQTYNSEIQIYQKSIAFFGNENTTKYDNVLPGNPKMLFYTGNVTLPGRTISFYVRNQRIEYHLGWSRGLWGKFMGQILFALKGQPDQKGKENNDIYISANRVIDSKSDREGKGVKRLEVLLVTRD